MKRSLMGVVLPFVLLLNSNNVDAIVGGANAAAGHFPSQVLIQLPNNSICGGTIIHPNHVVTAARCVFDLQTHLIPVGQATIRAGILATNDPANPINVVGIFPHPLYNPFTNENNIAVLRTANAIPIRAGQANQPAIAVADLAEHITADNTQCQISGWNPVPGTPNVPLTFLNVPVMNRDTCNAAPVHMGRVHETMLCAGGVAANIGVCANTQGGGLFCNQNNNQRLFVGVLTGGFGCGAANRPGIYTQVRVHRAWILQQLARTDIPAAGPTPTPPAQGNQPAPTPPVSGAGKEFASVFVLFVSMLLAFFKL